MVKPENRTFPRGKLPLTSLVPRDDFDLCFGQSIQLVHQHVNLPVGGLDWVLESCLSAGMVAAASFLCRANMRPTRATILSWRATFTGA